MNICWTYKSCFNFTCIWPLLKFMHALIKSAQMYEVFVYDLMINVKVCQNDIYDVATPLWPSVRVKPNTSKVGDLESSGTPECLEFDSKAQNTSH